MDVQISSGLDTDRNDGVLCSIGPGCQNRQTMNSWQVLGMAGQGKGTARYTLCMLTCVLVELVEEVGQEASRTNKDERGLPTKRKRGELLCVGVELVESATPSTPSLSSANQVIL